MDVLCRSSKYIICKSYLFSGIQKETYRKVPCVAGMPASRLEINKCNFKGDTVNDSDCTGILSMNSDCFLRNSTMAYFKCGGIMVEALP